MTTVESTDAIADASTIAPAVAPHFEIAYAALPRSVRAKEERARREFDYYRFMMTPGMLTNWWTKQVSAHLQTFYKDLIAGKRPKLALMAPPQHGKSKADTDFTACRE